MSLPTPEQEQQAIVACLIFVLLAGIGIFSLAAGVMLAVVKTAKWVFGA